MIRLIVVGHKELVNLNEWKKKLIRGIYNEMGKRAGKTIHDLFSVWNIHKFMSNPV